MFGQPCCNDPTHIEMVLVTEKMQKLCRVGASGKKALVITNLANG